MIEFIGNFSIFIIYLFSLNITIINRHFNFIGQKYAVLEMKSLISKLLRNYKLIDVGHEPELRSESVLKSGNGICIGLLPRNH